MNEDLPLHKSKCIKCDRIMDMNETELQLSCQAWYAHKPYELFNVFICPACILDLVQGVFPIEQYRKLLTELRNMGL